MEPSPDQPAEQQPWSPQEPVAPLPAVPPQPGAPMVQGPQPIVITPTQSPTTPEAAAPGVADNLASPEPAFRPSEPVPSAGEGLPYAPTPPPAPVQPVPGAGLPPAPPQPFPTSPSSGPVFASPAAVPPRSKNRKKWYLFGGIALILLLTGGWVFGLYLPNTPANVYNTAINRSGKALSSLVTSATDQQKIEALKTSNISGSVSAKVAGDTYSGDFTTTFDKTNLNGGLDINLESKATGKQSLSAKLMSQTPAGSLYPDIYFQLNGLKALNVDQYMPGLSNYDSKWISVDSKYLQSLGDEYVPTTPNDDSQMNAADISELARASMAVTQQYVFSTAPDKSIFVKKSFVGKEKIDGLNTYHYKVGINKAHASAYCTALTNAVLDTNAYKKVSGQKASEIATEKKDAAKDCADGTKSIKASDSYDMWVDSTYKLIYKFRIYDLSDKGLYTEVGQIYKGGDALTLFVATYDAKDSVNSKFTLNTNIKTYDTTGTLTIKSISPDNPFDVTATIRASLSNDKVQVTKPADAVPIQQVLSSLGLGDGTSAPTGSLQGQAQDTERKTDINSLDAYIEVYYADNGYYPQWEQLNSATWRQANMKGLDEASITPPNSTATGFAPGVPTASQYGYNPTSCDQTGCQGFTVGALLSDGTVYSKQSY